MINESDKSNKQGKIVDLNHYRLKSIQDGELLQAMNNKPIPFHRLSARDKQESIEAMRDDE
ncbi:hypothetical protein NYE25_12250 [Paenibacillus sp. FSL E2-8871]|uniref:hypothetical protein n=1 Tax=Paenibacillus sp. FSL E2-8871 TaxID=2975326 RepID=UPI0030FAEB69